MDITEFNEKIFHIIDGLNPSETEKIQKALFEKGSCENISNNSDQSAAKEAVKKGIQKISMEDLESIAPEQIKEIIQQFKDSTTNDFYNDEETQDVVNLSNKQEETKDDLIREAISISGQRLNDREEIPRDLRTRLGYIAAKLNVKYKLSKREITKLININNITVSKYISECVNSQPDLVRMWSGSAEAKSIQKIEETMAKTSADRTIANLKDSIYIADNIREKYAIVAAQTGYNLYAQGDLERLVNKAVQLYFSIDSVYINIIALELENTRLRQQMELLKDNNEELEEIKQLLLNLT